MPDEDIVDLSELIDAESMPICPFCDNSIVAWEPAVLFFAHEQKGLAHSDCLWAARQGADI